MATFLPLIVITAIHSCLAVALWPSLSRVAIVAIAASLVFSFLNGVWVEMNFSADEMGERRNFAQVVRDLRYSIHASMAVPAPVLAGVLSVLWFAEGRVQLALAGLMVCAVLIIALLRSIYR